MKFQKKAKVFHVEHICDLLIHLHQQAGDVIVLRRVAHEHIERSEDALHHFGGRRLSRARRHCEQALLSILFVRSVDCLHHSIGEDDEPVTGCEHDAAGLIGQVGADADRQPARVEPPKTWGPR